MAKGYFRARELTQRGAWTGRAERHRLDDRRRRGEEGQVLHPGARGDMVRHDDYAAGAVSGFVQATLVATVCRKSPFIPAASRPAA